MRVEFNQGVPEGCVEWLWDNIGEGNLSLLGERFSFTDCTGYDWFYERIEVEIPSKTSYVPTITVKDPMLATLFVLRWS